MIDVFLTYKEFFQEKYPRLRESQKEILQQYEQIRFDKNIITIEAPTGTGKSLINMIIALSEETDYLNPKRKIVIASNTKTLQYQYYRDFNPILEKHLIKSSLAMGVSSYICLKTKKHEPICPATIGLGCPYYPEIIRDKYSHLKNDPDLILGGFLLPFTELNPNIEILAISKRKPTKCPYWLNQIQVLKSKVIFANHHYLLIHLLNSKFLPAPSILIIDEYHRFPEIVSQVYTLSINKTTYKLLQDSNLNPHHFIKSKSNIKQFLEYLQFLIEYTQDFQALSRRGPSRIVAYNIYNTVQFYKIILEHITKPHQITTFLTYTLTPTGIIITPTYYAHLPLIQHLSMYIDKIILSSATPPPKTKTPEEIRLYSDKDAYPPLHRPVFLVPDLGVLSENNILKQSTINTLLKIIKEAMTTLHINKIVIHSINNFLKDYIGSILIEEGFPTIITQSDIKKDIQKFKKLDQGILISAGVEEGLDLKYDFARLQIILKHPLPNIQTDPYTRHLVQYDKQLYHYYIALRVVQAAGRIARAYDDIGITIILDKRTYNHIYQHRRAYPKFFLDAVFKLPSHKIQDIIHLYDIAVERLELENKLPKELPLILSKLKLFR